MASGGTDGLAGQVRETYVAAIQHDLVEFDADARLVGVVRRPTGWFHTAVDENRPELGPPETLLDEVKDEQEDLKMQGMCDEGAHNAAWENCSFADRYGEYLAESGAARAAVDDLASAVETGTTVVLVCFEGENKRCHRHALVEEIEGRLNS
ncbi:DUF488 family protein, N3 subclade [Halorientalis salina]|uniref:DUF488 family protein, N3 subclade n=1 Tax=Halorientalis salina TaxID=2932266 RepID=UPI0010AD624C|nr:DUF488 family protein [Halorientalis salina]